MKSATYLFYAMKSSALEPTGALRSRRRLERNMRSIRQLYVRSGVHISTRTTSAPSKEFRWFLSLKHIVWQQHIAGCERFLPNPYKVIDR